MKIKFQDHDVELCTHCEELMLNCPTCGQHSCAFCECFRGYEAVHDAFCTYFWTNKAELEALFQDDMRDARNGKIKRFEDERAKETREDRISGIDERLKMLRGMPLIFQRQGMWDWDKQELRKDE